MPVTAKEKRVDAVTQSVQSTGITRIAEKAAKDKDCVFTNLAHHVTPALVLESIKKMPRNTAAGVDKLTRDQVIQNFTWMVGKELTDFHQKRYEAPPARRVFIPKTDGGQRPLGVPCVLDRGIQGAVTKVLEGIYETMFLDSSFGFRPEIGCHNALATLQSLVSTGYKYILEVDIKDFFGSLDHGWLGKFLRHRIGDQRILKLIDDWLKAGVLNDGIWEESETGTVQGGSISPLLANIYLHYVLDLWIELAIKRDAKIDCKLIRYADDFVIMFRNESDRDGFLPVLEKRLNQFKLQVSVNKTHKTNLTTPDRKNGEIRRSATFLGFIIHRATNKAGTGYKNVFRTEKKRLTKAKANIKERIRKVMHAEMDIQVKTINWLLRGHYNYFGLPGNSGKLNELYFYTIRMWRRSLSRRSQKGSVTWEEFGKILKSSGLQVPKLKIKYGELKEYVIL